MDLHRLGAAALVSISFAFVAGCAAEKQVQADANNPCLGVAPATGSMIRRSADCGGASVARGQSSAADENARQMMVDEIRSIPSTGRSAVKP